MSTFKSNPKQKDLLGSQETDEWETPIRLFRLWDNEFHFTLDPCATDLNKKCPRYFTQEDDGLKQSWKGERVFSNPPYSDIRNWVKKCFSERNNAEIIVMLIYAKTDTKYFHDFIYPYAELRFIRGRIQFGDSKRNAPYASMLVIYKPNEGKNGQTNIDD